MGEKNPLQVNLGTPKITAKISNRSGRPIAENIVNFSPQPKSMVAQMLSKMNKNKGVDRSVSFAGKKYCFEGDVNDNNYYNSEQNNISLCLPLGSSIINFKSKPGILNTEEIISTPSKSAVCEIFEGMKKKEINVMIIHDGGKILDVQEERSTDEDKSRHTKEIEELPKHKQFVCDFPNCKYLCKLSSNLIKHKRVHTNEKPYLCEKCSFRSNFVNSLKVHRRTHTAERPYQCKHCDYKCNSSSNLKKHCMHRHPTSDDYSSVT